MACEALSRPVTNLSRFSGTANFSSAYVISLSVFFAALTWSREVLKENRSPDENPRTVRPLTPPKVSWNWLSSWIDSKVSFNFCCCCVRRACLGHCGHCRCDQIVFNLFLPFSDLFIYLFLNFFLDFVPDSLCAIFDLMTELLNLQLPTSGVVLPL